MLSRWLSTIDDAVVLRAMSRHRGLVDVPSGYGRGHKKRAGSSKEIEERVCAYLRDQYSAISSRRLAYELELPCQPVRSALARLCEAGRVEAVGYDQVSLTRTGRLYVAN